MMILLTIEGKPNSFDLIEVADLFSCVFMIAIKAIRNADARNEIWKFCAELYIKKFCHGKTRKTLNKKDTSNLVSL